MSMLLFLLLFLTLNRNAPAFTTPSGGGGSGSVSAAELGGRRLSESDEVRASLDINSPLPADVPTIPVLPASAAQTTSRMPLPPSFGPQTTATNSAGAGVGAGAGAGAASVTTPPPRNIEQRRAFADPDM